METKYGVVVQWHPHRFYAIIRECASNGLAPRGRATYFVNGRNVARNEVGARYLVVGERVSFVESEYREEGGRKKACEARAEQVVPLEREPIDVAGYSEDCVVVQCKSNSDRTILWGFARRPFGDSIYWHSSYILTEGEMHVGTKFNCVPVLNPMPESNAWLASNIEIYVPDVVPNGEQQQ